MKVSKTAKLQRGNQWQLLLALGGLALLSMGVMWWSIGRGAVGGSEVGLGQVSGDLHALAFASGERILYGQHEGLQVSSDGGRTWTRPSGAGDAMAIASAPEQPEVIYQAGHDLFLRSADGGASWEEPGFGNLPGTDIHGFAVAPENGWLYANIAGRGLYRSTSGDGNWELLSPATGGAMALAAGPGTPAVLYAATMDQGLLRSDDGGSRWERLTQVPGMSMSGIYVHPGSGNVYAAAQGGVYRSSDGGQWTALGPNIPMALVAAKSSDESKLVAVSQQGKIYRSDGGGATWVK